MVDGLLQDINIYLSLVVRTYLKPSYFSGTLILTILARDLVIAKFNACKNFAISSAYCMQMQNFNKIAKIKIRLILALKKSLKLVCC